MLKEQVSGTVKIMSFPLEMQNKNTLCKWEGKFRKPYLIGFLWRALPVCWDSCKLACRTSICVGFQKTRGCQHKWNSQEKLVEK